MELIYQLFTSPVLAMKRASRERPLGTAFLVVILAVLSSRIGWLLILPRGSGQAKVSLSLGLIMELMVTFGGLFLLVAIFHLIANLWGGSGRAAPLYSVSCFALIPIWLMTPLAIILKPLGVGRFLLLPLFGVIILVWIAALFILGIREVHHLPWGKAAATFIVPLIGISFAFVIFLTLSLSILFLTAADLFQMLPLYF
ncbi:YIP1 family protein [candidate division NPL-UPA2 bacterium]|nr:YIP1 family protein [candidate division NPL-UPA2 bacterium]